MEPITSRQFQSHLAKKRKRDEDSIKKKLPRIAIPTAPSLSLGFIKKEENKKRKRIPKDKEKEQFSFIKARKVRPGCKNPKLVQEDCDPLQEHDRRLLNYPSVEKVITPFVTVVPDAHRNKSNLLIDFNRPPYMDPRFRFEGYSMVFLSRHVKLLATALSLAANVFKEVPIYFDYDGIRIKKCQYDPVTEENFIFEVHFHHLLQYYCHVPMGFSFNESEAKRFAKRHCNQSGETSVIWKYNTDNRILIHLLNDAKLLSKHYRIGMIRNSAPLLVTAPLQDTHLSWDMETEELSKSCDELNLSNLKHQAMTFRLWRNAVQILSENPKECHVFGTVPDQQPTRENFQFEFAVSLSCLRKVCSRMKKSKGQEKVLNISVDSDPDSYVQFSQHLSDQITFRWWVSKRKM